MTSVELTMPQALPHQVPWRQSPANRKLMRIGRRGGKTRFAGPAVIEGHGPFGVYEHHGKRRRLHRALIHGYDVIWIARDQTQARAVWRKFFKRLFGNHALFSLNQTNKELTYLPNNATLYVISNENIDSARGLGENLGGVVFEEAAHFDLEYAWLDVVQPMLLDCLGWAVFMSTTNAGPDGNQEKRVPSYFNLLCEDYRAGKLDDEWIEFTGTALDNPRINATAYEKLVSEYPQESAKLKQEIFAELLRDGSGVALRVAPEIIPVKRVPAHWKHFGAMDWGYNHPWVFGWFATDEDGNVALVDTVWGVHDHPEQIHAKVSARVPIGLLTHIAGSHDLKNDSKARGETGPSIQERLFRHHWPLIDATQSRVSGLNNLRLYIESGQFKIMDTPSNRWTLARMMAMQVDPDDLEDALKVDSDGRIGDDGFPTNGDDPYDMVRYALMSRPMHAVPGRKAFAKPNENVDSGVDMGSGKPVNPRQDAHRDHLLESWREQQQALKRHQGRRSMRGKPTHTIPL